MATFSAFGQNKTPVRAIDPEAFDQDPAIHDFPHLVLVVLDELHCCRIDVFQRLMCIGVELIIATRRHRLLGQRASGRKVIFRLTRN